jgi:hypothetical protein
LTSTVTAGPKVGDQFFKIVKANAEIYL